MSSVSWFLLGVCAMPITLILWAIVGDCTEYLIHRLRKRREGLRGE